MKHIFIFLINLYQRTLSPDHGWLRAFYPYGCCKFQPTCSEYGKEAFVRYGSLRGMFMTAGRILRCHPFAKGGFDPVK